MNVQIFTILWFPSPGKIILTVGLMFYAHVYILAKKEMCACVQLPNSSWNGLLSLC